nr:hypothetical protein [Tanacetum cinerariifolium]
MDNLDLTMEEYIELEAEKLVGVAELLTWKRLLMKDPADYGSNTTPRFEENAKFKLGDKFLKILMDNAFNRINGDNIVDHTAKVLAILELIKISTVDPNQLRLHVFPLSLTGDVRTWWMDE